VNHHVLLLLLMLLMLLLLLLLHSRGNETQKEQHDSGLSD
jgi:hypothetical protein